MSAQDAVDAAMRVYSAMMRGSRSQANAEFFARQVADASSELDGGFEELTAGLLQIVALLTKLLADRQEIPKEQVVHAVGLALTSRSV